MSQTAAAAREPLLRIAKREGTTMPQKIAVRAIAILLALVVDALFIFFVTGLNPLAVYGVMWGGTFANMTRFSWMLRDLSILLCVGIALAPGQHCRRCAVGLHPCVVQVPLEHERDVVYPDDELRGNVDRRLHDQHHARPGVQPWHAEQGHQGGLVPGHFGPALYDQHHRCHCADLRHVRLPALLQAGV